MTLSKLTPVIFKYLVLSPKLSKKKTLETMLKVFLDNYGVEFAEINKSEFSLI